jgi:hypothetical protein
MRPPKRLDQPLKLRISSADLSQLRTASELTAVSVSEIVRRGAMKEARRILPGSGRAGYLAHPDRNERPKG